MALRDSIFQNFPGERASGPPLGSRIFGASRANSCPPPLHPKFLSPYAYEYKTRNINQLLTLQKIGKTRLCKHG